MLHFLLRKIFFLHSESQVFLVLLELCYYVASSSSSSSPIVVVVIWKEMLIENDKTQNQKTRILLSQGQHTRKSICRHTHTHWTPNPWFLTTAVSDVNTDTHHHSLLSPWVPKPIPYFFFSHFSLLLYISYRVKGTRYILWKKKESVCHIMCLNWNWTK